MSELIRTKLVYPTKGQARYFEIIKRFYEGIDGILYAHREDRNVILYGGGLLSWDSVAGTLTFNADIILLSPHKAYWETISQAAYSPITVEDGEMIYVELTRSPGALIDLVPRVTNVLPQNDNAFMIAFRDGDILYIRNGRGFANGDTGPIYNSAVDDPISGFTRKQVSIQVNGDTWIGAGGVADSAAAQIGLAAGFTLALMAPGSLDVCYNNALCHYTAGAPGSVNEWRWVIAGAPAPVIEIGAGSLVNDVVTVKYPH